MAATKKNRRRKTAGARQGKVTLDYAVLIPTPPEFRTIISAFEEAIGDRASSPEGKLTRNGQLSADISDNEFSYRSLYVRNKANSGVFSRVGFFCFVDMGNTLSAAMTAYVANTHKPTVIISAGIAGSMSPSKNRLGDVLMPSSAHYLGFNKVGDAEQFEKEEGPKQKFVTFNDIEFYFRKFIQTVSIPQSSSAGYGGLQHSELNAALETIDLDKPLKQAFEDAEIDFVDRDCQLLDNKPIFSWEKVLNSRVFTEHLASADQSIIQPCAAVDMESYGFLRTLNLLDQQNRPLGLIVRGLSDYVGLKHITDASEEKNKWRNLAMRNVARVIAEIIE